MSYDLFFEPRTGALDFDRVRAYFRSRRSYSLQGDEVRYLNDLTGVYFTLTLDPEAASKPAEEAAASLSFTLNYFRPSYFALEAEAEISALVAAFDLVVSDPQADGMGEGDYSAEGLVRGWTRGNEVAHLAILGRMTPEEAAAQRRSSLPAERQRAIWRWNYDLPRLRLEMAQSSDAFAPRIALYLVDDAACAAAVWPDAIPCRLPKVDYLLVGRDALAPKGLFSRKPDEVLAPWSVCEEHLLRHGRWAEGPAIQLDYETPPPDLRRFVRGLAASARSMTRLSPDAVLDAELVEKHLR